MENAGDRRQKADDGGQTSGILASGFKLLDSLFWILASLLRLPLLATKV
jgi:hypothetical protein